MSKEKAKSGLTIGKWQNQKQSAILAPVHVNETFSDKFFNGSRFALTRD